MNIICINYQLRTIKKPLKSASGSSKENLANMEWLACDSKLPQEVPQIPSCFLELLLYKLYDQSKQTLNIYLLHLLINQSFEKNQ